MSDGWTFHESARELHAPTDRPAWPLERRATLAALPRQHRPREKALARGVSDLCTTELLALVLGNGSAKTSAGELALRLVRRHGLKGLKALTVRDWTCEPGVGVALAVRLPPAPPPGGGAGAGGGGGGGPRTPPRAILRPAIAHLALGFILVHNHPSGSLAPSDEDVAFTRAIHRAAETIGIELYDHLIVAGVGFTSLRERGAF